MPKARSKPRLFTARKHSFSKHTHTHTHIYTHTIRNLRRSALRLYIHTYTHTHTHTHTHKHGIRKGVHFAYTYIHTYTNTEFARECRFAYSWRLEDWDYAPKHQIHKAHMPIHLNAAQLLTNRIMNALTMPRNTDTDEYPKGHMP
jgi:hypothetical protein